jgi:hypothetical protein
MKSLFAYKHLTMLLLVLLTNNIWAITNNADSFFGNFAIEARGGIAPTAWINRDNFSAISINATSILLLPSAFVPLFQMPSFSKLFGLPWFIGIHIGSMMAPDQEIYAEINYRQAHKRIFTLNNLVIPNIDTIFFSLMPKNNYRVLSAFVGARKYWQFCSQQSVNAFFGGKIGLTHHAKTDFTFTTYSLAVPAPYTSDTLVLFRKNTGFAGGFNAGFEFDFGCDLRIVFTAEMVAACGPNGNENIPFDYPTQSVVINPFLAPNSFIVGSIGTELFFPITIGCKYFF